ncbi:uncharacterized protein ACMZJ9_019439 [Mantella aurantiaca]
MSCGQKIPHCYFTVKMLVKMIAVALVFTIAGSKAEVTNKKLASAFLDYTTQVSNANKNGASVLSLSDISKQVSDLLEKNMKNIDIENLQRKVSIFANSINKLMINDKAQQPMLDELERLRTTLSAPALEVNSLFSTFSKELLVKLTLYCEDLQAKVDKNALAVIEKLESINLDLDNTRLITNTYSMRLSLALNLQNLESTILENLEEVRANIKVYSEKVSEKLGQQSLMLINSLTSYGDDLLENLRNIFEATSFQIKKVVDQMQTTTFVKASQLKEQVSFFKSSLLGKTYLDVSNVKKTTYICLSDMNQKILLLKDTVALYGEALKKTLVEGLEDMKRMKALYSVQDSTKTLDKNIQEKMISFINSTLFMSDS